MRPRLLRSGLRLFGASDAQQLRFKLCHRGLPSTLSCYIRWESTNPTKLETKPADNFAPASMPPTVQPEADALVEQHIKKVRDYAENLRNHPDLQMAEEGYKPDNFDELNWRAALAVLEACISQRVPISRSYTVYVMSVLVRSGQIEHAEALFEAIIARRGGMSLNINHARTLLKYYTSRLMQNDASRIFDVTQAFLHDPHNIIWLHYYMMQMYAELEDYDRFENIFLLVRDLPEERERQLCHQVLLDTFAKRSNTDAVLKIYNQMKSSGIVPVGHVMARLFRALELNRAGEVAWEIYTTDFWPGFSNRVYDFKAFEKVTKSLIVADSSLLQRLLNFIPPAQHFLLLWLVDPATQDIENLIESVVKREGLDGPSKNIILKAALGRAAVLEDWPTAVQCYEAIPGGDSKRFHIYAKALVKVGRADDVVRLYYSDAAYRFRDPPAMKVLLAVFDRKRDGDGVASVLETMLNAHSNGRAVSWHLFDVAVNLFMQLRPLSDIVAMWRRLLVHHTDRISPSSYLSVALGHLRFGDTTLACRFFVDALASSTRLKLLRADVANAYDKFCEAGVFRKHPQLDLVLAPTNPFEIFHEEAHEILSRISYDLDVHGVFIRANARLTTPFSDAAPFANEVTQNPPKRAERFR
eukprot:TRINITY_DN9987_c0_g1_i1.p1 TRINITY_DN9987_c0_g1~~TRINITY_DN9987_c0_g1_i1.p1  ORF type:complete len:641 (-),score=76.97 TRINITY_DN9987_c0_g1_i1:39-1961(-)